MSETSDWLCVSLLCVWQSNDNIAEGNKWTFLVWSSQINPGTLDTYWGEPDQSNTDYSANYYDTPKYVVDIRRSRVQDIHKSFRQQKSPTAATRNRTRDYLTINTQS